MLRKPKGGGAYGPEGQEASPGKAHLGKGSEGEGATKRVPHRWCGMEGAGAGQGGPSVPGVLG